MNWRGLWVSVATLSLCVGCGRGEVFGLGSDTGGAATPDLGATSAGDGGGQVRDVPLGPPDAPPVFDAGTMPPFDSGPVGDANPPFPDTGPPPRTDAFVPNRDATVPDGGIVFGDADVIPDVIAPPLDAMVPIDTGPAADTGPAPECMRDQDCGFAQGRRRRCEPTSMTCVDCLNDNHCFGSQVCDTMGGFICRQPCFGTQCPGGDVCDVATGWCVDCVNDGDCNGTDVCVAATNTCEECANDADCALSPGQPFCDSTNECVACRSNADCMSGEVCDQAGDFCRPDTGRTLCTPCSDDDQCGTADDLCIGYVRGGGFFDRACSQDCTNTPCPQGHACISVRGGSSMQCRPAYSMQTPTCAAHRNLGSQCRFTGANADNGCGLGGVQDARCEMDPTGADPNAGICVIWCDDNTECPMGTTCQGATPMQVGRCR